ncbi:MAG: hypothetical protein ABIR28_09585 [Vicinamibacteria bacterium]
MRYLTRIPVTLALLFACVGFASAGTQRIPVTPIGVREMQTRSYDDTNAKAAMRAALDMLQDGGFNIERADATFGLVVGRGAVVRRPSAGKRALKYLGAAFSYGLIGLIPLNQTDELDVSVNVSAIDDDSVQVRIVIQRRYLDKNGKLKKTETVSEGQTYQDLFELFGRSLFVSQAGQ